MTTSAKTDVTLELTNYDGEDYEQGFWGSRSYEDEVEQSLVRKMTPQNVASFVDIGSGFGRLLPAYDAKVSQDITLFDYSQDLLDSAKKKYKDNDKVQYVQGSFYELPFKDETFDGGVSVRVMHHVENVPSFLSELSRVMKKDAIFVLEYANKRNGLEILRKLLFRSQLNPFSRLPENRSQKGLTFNFHPSYIKEQLRENGFIIEQQVASSLFRLPFLKRLMGQSLLAKMENLIPLWLRANSFTPSIFLKIRKVK
jgi:ubiquinone/menaquinone biosynthesis C-methylase UbiE